MPTKRVADMTPAEYRQMKYRRTMNRQGIKLIVPAGKAGAHVRGLHARGMAYDVIAERAGVAVGTVWRIAHDYPTNVENYRAVLGVLYEDPANPRGGGMIDPTGTRRRMQALYAIGFNTQFQSDALDMAAKEAARRLMTGFKTGGQEGPRSRFVYRTTAMKVAAMYEKYETADPRDFGQSVQQINRAKNIARRHRYAPPSCWDADTIDNPRAVPEWTGACGTTYGFEIHQRDGIPLCEACEAADAMARGADRVFSPERLKNARKQAGLSVAELAEACGVKRDTVYQWQRNNPWSPKDEMIETVAAVLGVAVDDLYDQRFNVPGQSTSYSQQRIERHMFSAVKFRAARESRDVSRRKLARITGLSVDAIESWEKGRTKPQFNNLQKIAAALNVDPESLMREEIQ